MPVAQPILPMNAPLASPRLRAGRADTRNALSSVLRLARQPLRRRRARVSRP